MKTRAGFLRLAAMVVLSLPLAAGAQDGYEPDNSASAAQWINSDETQSHSIHQVGDADWARFYVGGSGAQNVYIQAAPSMVLQLIRGRDRQLIAEDWSHGGGAPYVPHISLPSLPPGTYFIRLIEHGEDGTIPNYELLARWRELDAYEPDNAISAAKRLFRNRSQNRTIHAAGNVDWAKFTVGSPGGSDFTAAASGNMQIWLIRGRDRRQLGYASNGGASGDAVITRPWLDPGMYYLKVTEQGNNAVVPGYQLGAYWTPASVAPDAYETDNGAAAAKTIARGRTQRRTIHVPGDADWAKFTVGGNGARSYELLANGGSSEIQMRFFGPNGANTGPGDQLDYRNGSTCNMSGGYLQPGTHYIQIRESGNNGTVSGYTLYASWVGRSRGDVWEPDNSAAAANVIGNGAYQGHSIHAAGDGDWVKFTVPAGGARNVVVRTSGTAGDTELFLYNAGGARIAYDDNSGDGSFSRIELASLAPGTYYALVRELGNDGAISSYGLDLSWTSP